MKITENLTAEHRIFSELLGLIENAINNPALFPDAVLKAMVKMLAVPLERHADTEEKIFFPSLETHLGRNSGPLAVMESEHRRIRKTLDAIGRDESVRENAGQLVEILRGHIHKEDHILFVMAQEFLGTERLMQMAKEDDGMINR